MSRKVIDLRFRAKTALLAGARQVHPGVQWDSNGYAPRWQENILPKIPIDELTNDFAAGAGGELERKLCAAHSSAALVVNAFGPWRMHPETLSIGGMKSFRNARFEAMFPTGLNGTPPHLDFFAAGESTLAIESKCTEWMTETKTARFSKSYDRLQTDLGESPWFQAMCKLRAEPNRYRFVDAAQLVKHAFGLLRRFGKADVQLMYLYWEPANASEWPICRFHRAEAAELAAWVQASNIRLVPLSYPDLWDEWEKAGSAPHVDLLKVRYNRAA